MVKHTQTVCWLLPWNCLSVFGHFVGSAFKGLTKTFAHGNSLKAEVYSALSRTLMAVLFLQKQLLAKSSSLFLQKRSNVVV